MVLNAVWLSQKYSGQAALFTPQDLEFCQIGRAKKTTPKAVKPRSPRNSMVQDLRLSGSRDTSVSLMEGSIFRLQFYVSLNSRLHSTKMFLFVDAGPS